ncbi:response regulator transcription factor [Streptomyces sp. NPDC059788]|uniref:helix-turn-helix transcriptional regulator n=1 Tax=Streptomyces sp. NPDC059788 TaxID=3346948 RepID=UPI003660BD73
MPVALRTAPANRDLDVPGEAARVSDLRGRLREMGGDAGAADTAVTTCLVWIAGLLMEIAEELGDPRTAEALVDEAMAVLASAPRHRPVAPAPAPAPTGEPLTDRELTVLRRLQGEVSLRRIAGDLFVSYNTVKSHTRAVYRKLGVHSRVEALHRARERGLI